MAELDDPKAGVNILTRFDGRSRVTARLDPSRRQVAATNNAKHFPARAARPSCAILQAISSS